MTKKKYIIFFILIFVLILGVGGYIIKYLLKQQETSIDEYTPEEEISEEQSRETIVTIYFTNKETKTLVPEARMIDIKDLINNPYIEILNLLKEGPKSSELEKIFPDDIEFKEITKEGDILKINLSDNYSEYDNNDKELKESKIKAIKKTMAELAEINDIKILINNEELNIWKDKINKIII